MENTLDFLHKFAAANPPNRVFTSIEESAKAVDFEAENEDSTVKSQASKCTRKVTVAKDYTSYVWEHFDVLKDGEGNMHARCKYCEKTDFKAEGSRGTSNCKRHLNSCKAYEASSIQSSDGEFDVEVYCEMFADAIVTHGYSLSIVEDEEMRELHGYLNPEVLKIPKSTIVEKVKALVATLKKIKEVGENVETHCFSDVESM